MAEALRYRRGQSDRQGSQHGDRNDPAMAPAVATTAVMLPRRELRFGKDKERNGSAPQRRGESQGCDAGRPHAR
jgi:hypothetical protein